MRRLYSYNPAAGGGSGSIADGSVTTAKLGGDITTAGKNLLDDADAAAQRTTLGLGTAATSASSAFAAASHTHPASQISDSTVAGRSLLTAADAAAQRTALGLGTAATTASTAYAAASHTHAAGDITSGTIATARLGSGTANNTTFLRGDNTWATPAGGGGGSVTVGKAFLTGTQVNSTLTPGVLTGATFTLTPGQTGTFTAVLMFTAAATTTGVGAGFRVAQGSGANANAVGSWLTYTNISSSVAATGLSDGDVYNVAGGANAYGELLSTGTTAGNNSCMVTAVVHNPSTNANTTVTFEFRSEVNASAVTAQIGSGVTAIIG